MAPVTSPRMNVGRVSHLALVLGVAFMLAGCRDVAGPNQPGIRIIAGAGQRDTVDALLPQALIIQVNGADGDPLVGANVRVLARAAFDEWWRPSLMSVARYTGVFGRGADSTTDGSGRVAFLVRMGPVAGPAMVDIEVTATKQRDSVSFTILPGAVTGVRVAPHDSAVYVGRTYPTRATTVDRHGNARDDAVELSVLGSSLTLDQGSVRGTAVGRGRVAARHGAHADTGWVSVIPAGTLAADSGARVILLGLDGTGYRQLPTAPGADAEGVTPAWAPNGRELLLLTGRSLTVVDVETGTSHNLFADNLTGVFGPAQYSRDGAWVYYSRNECNVAMTMWRVRASGTGAERVGPPRDCFSSSRDPSPSPDGSRLAFVSTDDRLHVLDIASNVWTALPIQVARPRWSPTDDRIAFTANETVSMINADGSGLRILTARGRRYADGLDWSPDGMWIAAYAFDSARIEIIDASSGTALPLSFTTNLLHPAWRP